MAQKIKRHWLRGILIAAIFISADCSFLSAQQNVSMEIFGSTNNDNSITLDAGGSNGFGPLTPPISDSKSGLLQINDVFYSIPQPAPDEHIGFGAWCIGVVDSGVQGLFEQTVASSLTSKCQTFCVGFDFVDPISMPSSWAESKGSSTVRFRPQDPLQANKIYRIKFTITISIEVDSGGFYLDPLVATIGSASLDAGAATLVSLSIRSDQDGQVSGQLEYENGTTQSISGQLDGSGRFNDTITVEFATLGASINTFTQNSSTHAFVCNPYFGLTGADTEMKINVSTNVYGPPTPPVYTGDLEQAIEDWREGNGYWDW